MDWYSFCLLVNEDLLKLKITMKKILTIAFAGILLSMTSCQKETIQTNSEIETQPTTNEPNVPSFSPNTIKTTTTTNPPSDLSLLQYLKGENDCSIFYQAVFRTGIDIDISGDGPFTVFVPNDVAFQAFLESNNWTSIDDISQNILTMIVKYHVSNVGFKISELESGIVVPLFLSGKEAYINMDDPINPVIILGLTSAEFVEVDLENTNGMIHKINGVLAL